MTAGEFKFEISEELTGGTLSKVYENITTNEAAAAGATAAIAYPTLTVHGNEARLQKIIKQKGKGQFSVLGVRIPNGDTPWSRMSEADQGSAYFKSVGDTLNGILK